MDKSLQEQLEESIEILRETRKTLWKIENKEKVFFNITLYQKMGLVKGKSRYYIDSHGEKQWLTTDWYLTAKAKRLLNNPLID